MKKCKYKLTKNSIEIYFPKGVTLTSYGKFEKDEFMTIRMKLTIPQKLIEKYPIVNENYEIDVDLEVITHLMNEVERIEKKIFPNKEEESNTPYYFTE